MKRTEKIAAFRAFMQPYFHTGDAGIIAAAKKEYRRQYKKVWAQQKKETGKQVKLFFTTQEISILHRACTEDLGTFIKQCSLAYCTKQSFIPHPRLYATVREMLIVLYQRLSDIENIAGIHDERFKDVLTGFIKVEQTIHKTLFQPIQLDTVIAETIAIDPTFKETLLQIIQKSEQ